MEMLDPTMLLILGIVAFAAGFIDAVAGGGGMLTVPALLSIGLPPHFGLRNKQLIRNIFFFNGGFYLL